MAPGFPTDQRKRRSDKMESPMQRRRGWDPRIEPPPREAVERALAFMREVAEAEGLTIVGPIRVEP